jgi:hypothetical protein
VGTATASSSHSRKSWTECVANDNAEKELDFGIEMEWSPMVQAHTASEGIISHLFEGPETFSSNVRFQKKAACRGHCKLGISLAFACIRCVRLYTTLAIIGTYEVNLHTCLTRRLHPRDPITRRIDRICIHSTLKIAMVTGAYTGLLHRTQDEYLVQSTRNSRLVAADL